MNDPPVRARAIATVTTNPISSASAPASFGHAKRRACGSSSVRAPNGVTGEEAIVNSDLVRHEQTEENTDGASPARDPPVDVRETMLRRNDRERERGGHQHHPGDCSHAKNS